MIHLFSRKPTFSTRRALQKNLKPRHFELLLSDTPDRRQLVASAARSLAVGEIELIRALAKRMNLPVCERPTAMNPEALEGRVTLAELRRAGAVLSTSGDSFDCLIAVDPAVAFELLPQFRHLPAALGAWELIARALDASEQAIISARAVPSKSAQDRDDLCKRVCAAILHEVTPFGVSEIELDLSLGQPEYRFLGPDGRAGVGSVSASIRDIFQQWLRDAASSEQPQEILLPRTGTSERISVSSATGLFRFTLRWGKDLTAVVTDNVLYLPGAGPEKAVQPGKEVARRRPRVLVVDDNETFARVLERFFRRQDLEVLQALDGDAARRELLGATVPDLVVTDVHMHAGFSGGDLVRLVRSHDRLRNLPVIVLTSDASAETEIKYLGLGADAFLSKSEDPRILCAYVGRLLARSGIKSQEAA